MTSSPRKLLMSAVLWCIATALWAQSNQYQFTRIGIEQGLSHYQINCIHKDRKGFMWFGSQSGLNRYDGYQFKVFHHDLRDSNSLYNNYITSLLEDPEGRIWVNTRGGVNIYDPQTESLTRSTDAALRRYQLPDPNITDILKDRQGNYWFAHANYGLYRYDPGQQKTKVIRAGSPEKEALQSDSLADLEEDAQGNLWILYRNGTLERLNTQTFRVDYRNATIFQQYKGTLRDYRFYQDTDGDLWVYSGSGDVGQGIYYFNLSQQHFTSINTQSEGFRLNNNVVRGVIQDNKGLIWIATDHGGINLLNKKERTVAYLLNDPNDEKSLVHNSVYTLYKDDKAVIWIGLYKKGISYYHESIFKFPLYRYASDTKNDNSNDVNAFAEDPSGNLWVGTNGGGLLYFDRSKNAFTPYVHNPRNPASLSNNVIVGMHLDREQKLWIGTFTGGLNMFDGKKFTQYTHDPSRPESIASNNAWCIMEDSRQNLWVGTLGGGLDRFDRKENVFYHYKEWAENSVHSNYISSLLEDREGNIWVGTAYGIDVLYKNTEKFTHYLPEAGNPESLSNYNINTLIEDSRGIIWVGTLEGLNAFDKKTGKFRVFRKEDGLPDNTILAMLEDNQGDIWVSTPNGISHVKIQPNAANGKFSCQFRNYDEEDGLQGRAFNERAAIKSRQGELLFGGARGFNLFKPEMIGIREVAPQVVLTDLQIFNKSVQVGEQQDGRVILQKALNETEKIVLEYGQNMFSIEFAALSYFQPGKNQYAYMLEGFNKDWLTTDAKARKVTYTNLNPSTYTFRVKAANSDGFWNEEGVRLSITVLPPFWKSPVAMMIYGALLIGTLLMARQITLARARMNFRIEQERQEAHRMHELDMMKIKFFTNVSHEFRTPLTLVLTPLEKLLKNSKDADQKSQYLLIYRNARRLLNLVNQLLDFRRMEVQEIRLNATSGEIIRFLREVTASFTDLSEKKHIHFTFHSEIPELETAFDHDKLERILFNLLSNAFKFTPVNGSVSVRVKYAAEEQEEGHRALEIRVMDSGIGIPPEKHEKIFERFFQNEVPGSLVNQGSGIGLAITREFVKLHQGSIRVESIPDHGSSFVVKLPIQAATSEAVYVSDPILEELSAHLEEVSVSAPANSAQARRPWLLLVEDNEDFRFYLKDNLKVFYNILEAANGKEGWRQTLTHVPDLIVSDVMMPEMDGIAFCRKIKNDPRTSHIPTILLTSRSTEEQKLEGFETGANDYITKPFNFEILQARIKNLIAQRKAAQKALQQRIDIKPSEINVTSMDEKLIQKVLDLVEKNMGNPDFSVEELSREIGMSRVYLYKKLLSLTGKSPIEFIRTVRLKRAALLLEKSQLTVSEIAYQVGFNNPKYFTKYFKTEYKVLPSLYVAEKRKEMSS
jgi:signal transduction histidine kinase/ligand-binding sensor domain-containing protein/DNA-binding response OmpR family regulator